jgi:hypothetical protein
MDDYKVEILHDFGRMQIICTYGGRVRMHHLVVDGKMVAYLEPEDIPALAEALNAIQDSKARGCARQELVNTLGLISDKALFDRACIVQQIAELAEEMAYEIEETGKIAEDFPDDLPYF